MKKYLLMLLAIGISLSFAGCDTISSRRHSKTSSNTKSSASSSNSDKNSSSNSSSDKNSDSDTNSTASTNSNKTVVHKVGKVIDVKGKELTIKTVTKDYKSGNDFFKPESGNQYIKIDFTIENNTDNSINVSPFEFKILDSNGVYHGTAHILKHSFFHTELAKGGILSNSIAFEVPKNDNDLKLIYDPSSIWSDDHVEIKL